MGAHEGTTYKRCTCRNPNTNKTWGAGCPRLKRKDGSYSPGHGHWAFQYELPRTAQGRRRQARRLGLATREEASRELAHVKELLALAEGEAEVKVQIGDLVQTAVKNRQALPAVAEVRRRLGTGADLRSQPPTVGAYLHAWLSGKPDLARGTRASYEGHIRNHLIPHLGSIRLDRLTSTRVEAMFEAIEQQNLRLAECKESEDPAVRASVRGQRVISLSTKHRIRATLRSALSEAVRSPEAPLTVNAASHARLPSCARKRPLVWTPDRVAQWEKDGTIPGEVMVWTPEQTRRFLEHAQRYVWLHPLFHLIATKGLRRGEAVGLPWSNTRLTDGQADICTQIVQLSWQTFTSTPKSEAGRRTITLDAETIAVLRSFKKRQNQARLQAGAEWADSGLVFTQPGGSPWHPGRVSEWFARISRAAGLAPITLHGLRHGAASLALAAGTDVKVVSAELGHSTAHFTQDTYQTVFPDVARAAAEATAALLRGTPPQAAGSASAGSPVSAG